MKNENDNNLFNPGLEVKKTAPIGAPFRNPLLFCQKKTKQKAK